MNVIKDARQVFLDYFGKQGHTVVPSSPLVPRNDPTLMFTNAGMVQFKNVFTGAEKQPFNRAVSAQKCVRAGGKHNDLENVGYTARHHTFFEMLGNFSFGDYFKDAAIELAWNLVTKEFSVPARRLLVTVYSEDDEAASLWRKIAGLPDDRIIRIATADNFWSMGETGPCGPCSEIFFDHGDHIAGGPPGSADQDGDRFVEIWNLVFMQFEQMVGGKRVALPKPSIDTGMGLERISAVLEGKHDNYDTYLLRTLILASADLTATSPDGADAVSHRVIADHLRASSFLIADGVLPSNEGRGYVLRRIMRRAMRHAHKLGAKDPLMWRLVPTLTGLMGLAYPELTRAQALIEETLKLEETRFRTTLDRGLKLLEDELVRLSSGKDLPGEVAFKLYDTYGFPLDLTQDILRGQGRGVDTQEFQQAMDRQRAAARKAWSGSGEAATEQIWFDLKDRFGATEFLGYATEMAEGQIQALIVNDRLNDKVSAGQSVAVLTNQTPFYGESGGQQGDRGILFTESGAEIAVDDTHKRAGDLHVHYGRVTRGDIKVGDTVEMRVDQERRQKLRANHSVTHLLHQTLRRRLGDHVTQKGSLVAPDRLRFDFSHPRPVGRDLLMAIEQDVNRIIRANSDVLTRLMSPQDAVGAGALALFGEKYGDEVRVVSMGQDLDGKAIYSTELCGGTHVRRTGDIGFFKIVSESAVSSGIRRIEAVTGEAAESLATQQGDLLEQAAAIMKVQPQDLPARIQSLQDERRRLERELSDAKKQAAMAGPAGAGGDGVKTIGDIKFTGRIVGDIPPKDLKGMADDLKRKLGSGVVVLIARHDDRASVVAGVTADLTARIDAVSLVRSASHVLGGSGGGGRPDMAQAGGPDLARVDDAMMAVEEAIQRVQPQ